MARAIDEVTKEPIMGASIDLMRSGVKMDSPVVLIFVPQLIGLV